MNQRVESTLLLEEAMRIEKAESSYIAQQMKNNLDIIGAIDAVIIKAKNIIY